MTGGHLHAIVSAKNNHRSQQLNMGERNLMLGAYNRDIEKVIEEVKRNVVLGIFPKLVDPPPLLGTCRNKNVKLGQI